MNKKILCGFLAAAALFGSAAFTGCSSKSSTPSELVAQSERMAGEMADMAENSPMYLDSVSVAYADGTLNVAVTFADTIVDVEDYSDALIEYVVAYYIKQRPGQNLDTVLNTLSAENGSLKITLANPQGDRKECTIGASRLKKLFFMKPSELNPAQVKSDIANIMEKRAEAYREAYKAENAEFAFEAGFAQYELVFANASAYSNLTQDSLRGRYQNVLRAQYDSYGECRGIIEGVLESLGIEGYRFVYTDKNDTKTLKAALPWRIIQ
ncbi:hypothetical protein IMSAGC008_01092 [Muribaculaceae bacterium]|jgi:hypothetical protein|nr:hypothetical protein IMSAGC008_01092 [Muribaculaceae bacterium]